MASPRMNRIIAHLPGVVDAVHDKGEDITRTADRIFAQHNRPGGHEIVGEKAGIDYLVSIEGEVPHVLEFGRQAFTRDDGVQVGPMDGLRILGRAVEQ